MTEYRDVTTEELQAALQEGFRDKWGDIKADIDIHYKYITALKKLGLKVEHSLYDPKLIQAVGDSLYEVYGQYSSSSQIESLISSLNKRKWYLVDEEYLKNESR